MAYVRVVYMFLPYCMCLHWEWIWHCEATNWQIDSIDEPTEPTEPTEPLALFDRTFKQGDFDCYIHVCDEDFTFLHKLRTKTRLRLLVTLYTKSQDFWSVTSRFPFKPSEEKAEETKSGKMKYVPDFLGSGLLKQQWFYIRYCPLVVKCAQIP